MYHLDSSSRILPLWSHTPAYTLDFLAFFLCFFPSELFCKEFLILFGFFSRSPFLNLISVDGQYSVLRLWWLLHIWTHIPTPLDIKYSHWCSWTSLPSPSNVILCIWLWLKKVFPTSKPLLITKVNQSFSICISYTFTFVTAHGTMARSLILSNSAIQIPHYDKLPIVCSWFVYRSL
jgi:hypothetical protein